MSSILVVCTGNICRSPVGEAVLRSQLPEWITVTSAGTHADTGRRAAHETIQFVKRELGIEMHHFAQQLIKQLAEEYDLIATMTAEHRAWVARNAPRAVRRTFTLREIEQITAILPSSDTPLSLLDISTAASKLRTRAATKNNELDIADPYGGSPDEYEDSFQQVLTSSSHLATSLRALSASR